jgi:hypothetical protein
MKIERCAHCGGAMKTSVDPVVMDFNPPIYTFTFRCDTCRCVTSFSCFTETIAIAAFNRRADGWTACRPGNMPEDDDAVHKYKDSRMELCTVIVCERYQDSERFIVSTANRLNVKPTGTPYLDKQCTDGWVWSNGHQNITHWRPLPAPPSEGV